MDELSVLCTAIDDAVECPEDAVMLDPVPLCEYHRMQVALLVVPDLLAAAARAEIARAHPKTLPSEESHALISGARRAEIAHYLAGPHGAMVYFIENGALVKIGYTTNLRSRVSRLALREKNIMLLLRGGPTLERALHTQFAAHRVDGTEWFELSQEIREFIEAKLAQATDVHAPVGALRQRRAIRVLVELRDAVLPGSDEDGIAPAARAAAQPGSNGDAEPESAGECGCYPNDLAIEHKHLALWELLVTCRTGRR